MKGPTLCRNLRPLSIDTFFYPFHHHRFLYPPLPSPSSSPPSPPLSSSYRAALVSDDCLPLIGESS
ncbi:hypothetical protein F2Q69_00030370 [Brassica cretica]|uniref:Uncharacterized protein n=1 Tax=Brassica cretica TaxID=69181 RepID=A0A8S9S840_BRACR|nr:hypothetical protein F2Q69_00030370 [Brassica cretica]